MAPLYRLVPTATELRAIGTLYRRGIPDALRSRPPTADRRAPDERLIDLLDEPFRSVDDAYDRLAAVEEHLRDRSDRRSVFLTVYTEMTGAVRERIRAAEFADPDWVRSYLVEFADWYREAVIAFERGRWNAVPAPWLIAFNASLSDYTLFVQDALLGISAHINYDLPYTLHEVGIDPGRASKRADHDAINGILARLVDVVKRAMAEVYAAEGYASVSDLLGSFDEDFTLFGLVESRNLAWRNAVHLTDDGTGVARRVVDWRIRAVAAGGACFILAPSADPSVLWALRRIEGSDPPLDAVLEAFERRVGEG